MTGNEPTDRQIDSWFKRQRDSLHAPADLWDSLEPNLGAQNRPGWRQLFGFRWVAVRLTVRTAGVAAVMAAIAVTAVVYAVATGSLTVDDSPSDSRYGVSNTRWEELQAQSNVFAQPTATTVPMATPSNVIATATLDDLTVPGQTVPLLSGQVTSNIGSATQDQRPVIIVSDGPQGPAGAPGSTGPERSRLSRRAAEQFAEQLIPPGAYGMTPEQWETLVSKLMAGDFSDVDVSLLPSEWFVSYGVNPFVDTSEQRFSTFAMDVDTAAYTVMRGYMERGQFPPPASVRPEEYINFFEQGYPETDDTFAINVDGSLSPYADDGRFLLRIGIDARDILDADRKSTNIVLVVDTSGSMRQGNRIELVRRGIESMLEQMREGDTVAIIAYETDSRVVLPPTSDFDLARSAISDLSPGGSTNAQAGLRAGFSIANDIFDVEKSNHVILLSDGVANVGVTESGGLLDDIKSFALDGIYLSTVGVGIGNHNDALLEQLADSGDGSYRYIDTFAEAELALGANITGLLEIVAAEAKIQVEFNPDAVSNYRLVGYENRSLETEDFRDDSVDGGEVGAAHTVTAIYELYLREDGDGDLGSVTIRWVDPDTGEAEELDRAITGSDIAVAFGDASPEFRFTASVMAFAEVLRASPHFQGVSLSVIAELLSTAIAEMDANEQQLEFQGIVDKAIALLASQSSD